MIAPTSRRSSSSKPRIVTAGVPSRMPGGLHRRPLVEGHRVAVRGDLHLVQALLRRAARPLAPAQVDLDEVGVGATGEEVEAAVQERGRERVGVGADLALVGAEGFARGDLEAGRLRRDHVQERAALHPGEDRLVDRRGVLLLAEDEPGARAGEGLVARRGDEVAVRHRVRMEPRGDEPGDVGHVAEEERADLVGDLPEAVGLDRARVGGGAADDQLRPVLLRQAAAPRRSRSGRSRGRRRSRRRRRASRRS